MEQSENLNTNNKLKITVTESGDEFVFTLDGRLNTLTSQDLEDQVEKTLDQAKTLVFDLEKLEYLSSTGLRVLLGVIRETEDRDTEMILRNLTEPVKDVLTVTGFISAFRIE